MHPVWSLSSLLFYGFFMIHSLDLWDEETWGGQRLGGRKSKVQFVWIGLA